MRGLLISLLVLLAGCGGHAGGHAAASSVAATAVGKGKGRATLSVRWPARTSARLIPNAANAITVTLSQGTATVATKTVARPTDGTATSSASFTGLAYGAYVVTARAFPNADGSGTAQAAGGGAMTVTEDVPGTLAFAMDSTAASLAIVSQAGTIGLNQTVGVVASAKDASGAVVLLAAGAGQESLSWSATPAASATIAGTGPTVTVTGNVAGTVALSASLKVKDDGTSLAATTTLNVDAVADYRLALGGYPKTGGDAGNAGRGGGSGAAGAVGWTAQVGTAAVGAVVVDPNGTVYTGSGGVVSAVSRDGVPLWQATVAGTVNGLLVTRGGQLLVSAAKLTSLTGGVADWTFPDDFGATFMSREACLAPNVLSDGTVVEATNENVYALNPYARKVRWIQNLLRFPPASGAAVESDNTVVVWNGAQINGYAGTSGAPAFTLAPGATTTLPTPNASNYRKSYAYFQSYGFSAAPFVRGTSVAYPEATFSGTATVMRSNEGTTQRPSYIYGYGYSGKTTSYLRTWSGGKLTSTTLTDPANQGSTRPKALAADASGSILLTYSDHIATVGGVWSVLAPGSVGVSIGADGTVYVATTDAAGLVKAVDPSTGAVRWTASLPAKGTGLPPAIGPDGSLFAGTADGRVVQIR